MSVRRLNVLNCALSTSLDEAGFRHSVQAIGAQLGAERIGAAVYEAVVGHPIWPYHYHYSSEEWLYVISGTPELRDPGGRRRLCGGDLICFPSNHHGAHTVSGPGRLIIFSSRESPGPWVAVYPDSDKISVHPGAHEAADLNQLILPRSAALGYWHAEGTAVAGEPAPVRREETTGHPRPLVNALTMSVEGPGEPAVTGAGVRAAAVGDVLGGDRLDATIVDLDPGQALAPYHYVYGRETWLLILGGAATLRHPGGDDVLHAGDVVAFPEGPGGACCLINHGDAAVRAIVLSTQGLPASVCYPDSGGWVLLTGRGTEPITLRDGHAGDGGR